MCFFFVLFRDGWIAAIFSSGFVIVCWVWLPGNFFHSVWLPNRCFFLLVCPEASRHWNTYDFGFLVIFFRTFFFDYSLILFADIWLIDWKHEKLGILLCRRRKWNVCICKKLYIIFWCQTVLMPIYSGLKYYLFISASALYFICGMLYFSFISSYDHDHIIFSGIFDKQFRRLMRQVFCENTVFCWFEEIYILVCYCYIMGRISDQHSWSLRSQ